MEPTSMSTPPLADDERERLRRQYAEIATLAGGLAHEIKNPLSTISLNLELMAEDLAEGETSRERRTLGKIATLQRACRSLQSILEDFLQFARAGELHLETTSLNAVVDEFLEFYQPTAQEHHIEISPHLSSDLPPVELDKALFRQVLLNLALNATQAMPQGGLLEFQTSFIEGRVQLALIDNGSGMTPATLAKMYQVFYSTKPKGSGLGLATVKKIVEAHGCEIVCDSAEGKGTRFTILFPEVLNPAC